MTSYLRRALALVAATLVPACVESEVRTYSVDWTMSPDLATECAALELTVSVTNPPYQDPISETWTQWCNTTSTQWDAYDTDDLCVRVISRSGHAIGAGCAFFRGQETTDAITLLPN